jgi:DNA-binding transcriptional MerR regulator
MKSMQYEDLDFEWMQLIREALEMGLEKEDIRKFINREETVPVVVRK